MVRLCFVCLGNICRSPTAEGIMRHLVSEAGLDASIEIDSAGTGAWHAGQSPDGRSAAAARGRGVVLEGRARQFEAEDFRRFDYVLAMDTSNYTDLNRTAPTEEDLERLYLVRDFDPDSPKESSVPDPYYGGERGFEDVFDICHAACTGLLAHIRKTHGL